MSKYRGITTLEVLEGAENYNRWIAESIGGGLTSPALEFGAGIGNISQYFITERSLYLSDVDPGLVDLLKKRFKKYDNIQCIYLDVAKSPEKFRSFFSSICGVNVLEHIKDDEAALRNIASMLKKHGSLSLLVPAKQFAYTRLDKELGHYRRYERKELSEKIERAGFIIDELFYFNIVGLLSWIVRDKIERKQIQLKPYQISLFDSIVPFLKVIESWIRPPIGISLIVRARKK